MSEHHTQGRQGQGARHNRRYRSRSNRNYRQRMPRREEGSSAKPSLFKRILSFLGFGKKTRSQSKKKSKSQENAKTPPQRVRVAQPRAPRGGESAGKGRRRPASVLPKDQARLYVGNLSFEATEAELEDLFKGFGHVRSVEIIYNTRTYRSKGYAFVEMEQLADAQRAAEVLHGQPFMGRELMVSAASEKTDRPDAPAPAPAPKDEPQKEEPAEGEEETEVTFGEEVVVNLAPAVEPEKQPETPAEPPATEAPAEEAPAAESEEPKA